MNKLLTNSILYNVDEIIEFLQFTIEEQVTT